MNFHLLKKPKKFMKNPSPCKIYKLKLYYVIPPDWNISIWNIKYETSSLLIFRSLYSTCFTFVSHSTRHLTSSISRILGIFVTSLNSQVFFCYKFPRISISGPPTKLHALRRIQKIKLYYFKLVKPTRKYFLVLAFRVYITSLYKLNTYVSSIS